MRRSRLLAQTRRVLRRLADGIPLTWRGALVTALAGLALWRLGYGSLDLLVFVIGVGGLSLVILAALLVSGATLYLRRHDTAKGGGEPRFLESGSPIRSGFRLPGLELLPMVRLRWRWQTPDQVDCRQVWRQGDLVEEVVARRRCHVEQLRRRFEVFDAFGLCRLSWERSQALPLTVLPDRGRLKHLPVVQSMVAGEGIPHPAGKPLGDRMEIRRYVPGDSVRNILWKTFARTRQLNVRIAERSLDPGRKTVAYLLTGTDDEAAAAAARVALESGALGDRWLFGADGAPRPIDQLDEALLAIARSGSLLAPAAGRDGRPRGDLSRFLSQPQVCDELSVIVFASARDGAWRHEALEACRTFKGSLTFVLATDGIEQPAPEAWWHRLLFRPAPSVGIQRQDLSQLIQHLGSAGFSALVVDRSSGRSFGGQRLGLPAGGGIQ